MPSQIEWTNETINPYPGCTKIAAGCKNCYAERLHNQRHKAYMNGKKMPKQYAKPFSEVQIIPERIKQPLHWRNPRRIFWCSMGDMFHKKIPFTELDKVFDVINRTSHHTHLILTKRIERALSYYNDMRAKVFWEHLWLGVSCSGPEDLWMIDILLQIPAAVHFVSFEPLLENIDALKYLWLRQKCVGRKGCGFTGASYEFDNPKKDGAYKCPQCAKNHTYLVTDSLDWVIVGGESGPGARPMHPNWPRDLRNQCADAGVAFFFKQWGEWEEATHENAESHGYIILNSRQGLLLPYNAKKYRYINVDGSDYQDNPQPGSTAMVRVGKKNAGRVLDGRTWDEYPAGKSK